MHWLLWGAIHGQSNQMRWKDLLVKRRPVNPIFSIFWKIEKIMFCAALSPKWMFNYTNIFDNEIKMFGGAYFSFLYFLTFHVKVQYLLILISHENSFHRTILLMQRNSAETFALPLVILLGTTFLEIFFHLVSGFLWQFFLMVISHFFMACHSSNLAVQKKKKIKKENLF